jgi:hypothetical protein
MKAPSLELSDPVTTKGSARRKPFLLEVSDVTGTTTHKTDRFQPSTPAGAAAQALAVEMALPQDVAWALRDDNGALLQEDIQLGDQVKHGSKLGLMPRVHLG